MEISVRADRTVQQYGANLGPLGGCTIHEIDDDQAAQFRQPGTKTLNEDGTITVTPLDTSAEDETRAAAAAQRQADAQTLMAALPTQEARDALARLLGLA